MDLDITAQLAAWRDGDRQALDRAMPDLYIALRQIAAQRLSRESQAATVAPTELVNEAMARLLGTGKAFASRLHFLAVAALYMRSILTDRARDLRAGRRPGATMRVTLGENQNAVDDDALDLVAFDQALQHLEAEDARAAQVLEMHAFSGLSREEIAQVLVVSLPTVGRDLRFAYAFVNAHLT